MTDAGVNYLENAKRILEDVETANAAITGNSALPTGLLAVTAPMLFGQMFVMPSITRYLENHPETSIDAIFLDRVVNMLEEGLDVAIRIGHLPDSNMRALRVGTAKIILCASPEYIKKHGIPVSPTDLTEHSLISSRAINPTPEWRFEKNGKPMGVKIKPRLNVTSNSAAVEAALSGFGITRLISYQVAPYLQDGSLKTVLEEYEQPSMPIHILHREGRLTTPKVRSFIDMLASDLRNDPSLN
ncbi:MAG: LysR substrate-binding domain-containing protein [Emcibacteraceae bacterium]|nr:LysR substrate-binding domain-containing protein [Emcibacteraceae bacterium]